MPESDPAVSSARPGASVPLLLAVLVLTLAYGREAFFRTEGAPAGDAVRFFLAAAAAVWLGTRGRRFASDIGERVLAEARLLPCALFLVLGLLLATGDLGGPLWIAGTTALGAVTLLSARSSVRANPRRAASGAVLVAINLLFLWLLDAAVRVWIVPRLSHNQVFVTHDPLLGWKLRPGLSLDRASKDYRSHETVNRLGFRTPEVPFEKPAGVRRIVVVGDSHSEGYTVSDDETWTQRLQTVLSESGPTEVISLGVGGFSTDQELLSYLEYGRRFDPDLVLLQFCNNDLLANVLDAHFNRRKPRFVRFGDTLLLEGVPLPNLADSGVIHPRLAEHSGLGMVAEAFLQQLATQKVREKADPKEGWKVTEVLIRDLARAVGEDRAAFAVLDATFYDGESNGPLRRLLERQHVRYVDIAPAFPGSLDDYRVPTNLHWNQAGHRAVGDFLAGALQPIPRR